VLEEEGPFLVGKICQRTFSMESSFMKHLMDERYCVAAM
jgi:hypothetical protein